MDEVGKGLVNGWFDTKTGIAKASFKLASAIPGAVTNRKYVTGLLPAP
jgi:hypothetical protein